MLPPYPRSRRGKDGEISFPPLHCLNPLTNVATIVAEVNGTRVSCKVRIKDLRKKFQISQGEPMFAVTQHRGAIENAARTLIEQMKFESDGSVMINFNDL